MVVGCEATVHDGEDSDGVFLGTGGGFSHHGDHDSDCKGVSADLMSAIWQRAHELQGGEGAFGRCAVEFKRGLDDGGDGSSFHGDTAVDVGETECEEDLGGRFG